MSEYNIVETKYIDEPILIQSIKDIGYEVEVHKEPIQINGYGGRKVGKAHLVVRKNQFGGYGDVGFERTDKGFVMHADGDDTRRLNSKFGLGKLNKKYVENKIKKYVSRTSSCNIFSRNENKNGQLEIHLRIT